MLRARKPAKKKNSAFVKATIAKAALGMLPPFVRSALLDDDAFCNKFSFVRGATISFGGNFAAQRSAFLKIVREVLDTKANKTVQDLNGKYWKLVRIVKKGSLPALQLTDDERTLSLPDLNVISAQRKNREGALRRTALDIELPDVAQESWKKILAERPLTDDELAIYFDDVRNTPIALRRALQEEMQRGTSTIASIVPHSRTYYERLVGRCPSEISIQAYAKDHALNRRKLSASQFMDALHLSSHSSLLADIDISQIDPEDLKQVFEEVSTTGDRISQIGAIEVGLKVVHDQPILAPAISTLIEQIRSDDPGDAKSGFRLLSALFTLVDGELARARLFADAPPFYRRLASLSQASVIERLIMKSPVDVEHLTNWAYQARGGFFYMQGLADMRSEPRWSPDFADPSQMKEDFLGRVLNAAKANEESLKGSALHEMILGAAPESITSQVQLLAAFLPGPLEGSSASAQTFPDELAKIVEEQIKAETVGPKSFIALVNSALLFQLQSNYADSAADALKVGKHRLANLQDKEQLKAILNGLATVAAVSRSASLADEVRILLRRYLRDSQHRISVEEAYRFGVVAAASRSDINEWATCVGDWATELSFGEFTPDEARALHRHIDLLCQVAPELRITCGRADAALRAFNQIAA